MLATFTPSATGDPGPGAQVIGGHPAPDSYSWAVRLEVRGSGQIVCSGQLVHPRVVAIAAHCVTPWPSAGRALTAATENYGWWEQRAGLIPDPGDPAAYQVRVGTRVADGAVFRVESISTRPFAWGEFDVRGFVHDAAVLVLASPASTPILPRSATSPADGQDMVRVTGFGASTAPSTWPGELRYYDTTRAPDRHCAGRGADELCLHTGIGAGPCYADSGGAVLRLVRTRTGRDLPLSLAWVSRAGSPAGCGQGPQIVVNRASHEPWLRRQILRVELSAGPAPVPRGTRLTA